MSKRRVILYCTRRPQRPNAKRIANCNLQSSFCLRGGRYTNKFLALHFHLLLLSNLPHSLQMSPNFGRLVAVGVMSQSCVFLPSYRCAATDSLKFEARNLHGPVLGEQTVREMQSKSAASSARILPDHPANSRNASAELCVLQERDLLHVLRAAPAAPRLLQHSGRHRHLQRVSQDQDLHHVFLFLSVEMFFDVNSFDS